MRFNNIFTLLEELPLSQSWFKSLKDRVQPQQEWGEEDDRMYNRIVSFIPQHLTAESYTACINWLKSLKPQKQWKPSEEQIVVLELASKYERVFTPKQIDILINLKEQLKELKK